MKDFFGKRKDDEDGLTGVSGFNSKGQDNMVEAGKVDSVIGPGLVVKGELHSRGTLRIDGNVEGKVSADASVVVGEKGVVKAEIAAGQVVIGGTVHGKVNGREKVEILSTGRLYGDVTTKASKFVVSEGVIFEGCVSMGQVEETKQPQQSQVKTPRQAEEKQEVAAASKSGKD
jgi:cytoskeletal protein CcmA (bactofilin family)